MKRELRCPGYVRYVDDFVLFGEDKRTLWVWKEAIVERLARLGLTVHPNAQPRPVERGIPFLGFTVYPHRRRLKRRKGIHFARKLRALLAQCQAGEIPPSCGVGSTMPHMETPWDCARPFSRDSGYTQEP